MLIDDEYFNGSFRPYQFEAELLHGIHRGLENVLALWMLGIGSSRSHDLFHVEIEIVVAGAICAFPPEGCLALLDLMPDVLPMRRTHRSERDGPPGQVITGKANAIS